MAFTDVLGQYMDNRLNSLQDRLDTAGQYFTDPGAALENRLLSGNPMEDEEERKRREAAAGQVVDKKEVEKLLTPNQFESCLKETTVTGTLQVTKKGGNK